MVVDRRDHHGRTGALRCAPEPGGGRVSADCGDVHSLRNACTHALWLDDMELAMKVGVVGLRRPDRSECPEIHGGR